MKKRGQITTIIIIGIVAIILIITAYSFRDVIFKELFNIQYQKQANVPPQIDPIRLSMDSCIEQTASDAVNIVGQQGGYIDIPFEQLPTSSYTPFSAILEIFPNSGIKTAFWYYERPNGIKVISIPSLKYIETEIENYINQNLDNCVNNLTYYANQGYTIEIPDAPKTNIDIFNDIINVKVDYPLIITIKDITFNLGTHYAKINADLKSLYEIAKSTMEKENKENFFEEKTLDMMVAYDEIPFSGVDLSCAPKIWYKPEVIKNIKYVVSRNIANMRLKGTTYPEIDKYYEFDALTDSYPDIKANFMYSQNWPMVVEVTPSEGNVMRGNQISKKTSDTATSILSSFVCITDYHFVYDLKYPILTILTDKNGYIFQFATEIIIDNNQPNINPITPLNLPDVASPLCDFPTKEITVSTLAPDEDGTLMPLDNVDITLKCFPAVCNTGTTKLKGTLTAKFPACVNGVLEGKKEGYYPGKITIDTNEEQDQQIPVILEPLYKKHMIVKVIDKKTGVIRDPYESEQVSILFTNKDTEFSTSYIYPSEDPIELMVGNYEIQSYVIGNSTWPITFPKQIITKCVNVKKEGILALFREGDEKCFDTEIPETEMDMVLKGGVIFDYEFTRDSLTTPDMVFYTMAEPIPSSLNDLALLQQSLPENKNHPKFRYPSI